jgi:superfamily I DNA/RNA helicase
MRDDMKVSKGLEFPVVALPGVGHMPGPKEDEKDAAGFYVAATWATQRLVIGVGNAKGFSPNPRSDYAFNGL